LFAPLIGLARRLIGRRAARLHHVYPNQQQDNAPGDLKGRKRDAEDVKDKGPHQGEGGEEEEARPGGPFGHQLALRAGGGKVGTRANGSTRKMDDRVTRKNWSAWEISTGNLSRVALDGWV